MENFGLVEKFGLNEGHIFIALKRHDPNLRFFLRKIPLKDILQSIRLEMCNGVMNRIELYRNVHRALRQLILDFGYGYWSGGEKRKEIKLRYTEDGELNERDRNIDSEPNPIIEDILDIYWQESAKAACQKYGIEYNSTIASAFNRYFPKNVGHGGKRR